ncbi:hypothetical protein DTO045G8_1672 [Paecilomyces variotii]|nr:hypothetical protein DTO045G8_1672 [Paecilomyces variotii]
MPRTYGKVKQTRLSFTPVASSASPGAERSPGSDRVAKVRYEHPSKVTLSRGRLRIDDYPAFSRNDGAAGSVEASSLSTPVKKKKKDRKNRKKGSKSKVKGKGDEGQIKEEESSDDERKESSVRQSQSQSRLSASSDEDDDIVQASARRRRGQSGVVVFDEDSESDSDGSATPVPTTRKSHEGKESRDKATSSSSRKLRSGKTSGNKGSNAEMRTPLKRKYTATESEDDSESPVLTGRSSRTRPSTRQPLEQNSSGASDEEEVVAHSTTRRLKRGAAPSTAFPVDDSDDSDDVILSSPAKRRRLDNGPEALRTPRQTSDQDRLDLEEDLEDLKDSAVKKTRTRGRPADSARLTRQKQLELLRRRRAGEKAISVSESQHSDNESDGEGEQSESVEELDEDESGSEDSQDSDVEPPVSENEDLDRYEDDFVLQDDEGELGAPTDLADMPFEFTRHSYKKPKEFFRDVVEWMVHNKLNPAFPRNDPVYQVAFMKLEDEVKGRAGSQLVSTVWNSDFRRALMARPQIEVTLFPITEGHPCDACNRSGHPASFDVKLYGKPYSLETLEPLSDDEDSDEQSEESHDTRDKDKDGNPLPDEDRRFYLGRHCKSRATMAHTLVHWRFHLSEWVISYLEHQGVFSDEKIIERSHWSVKRQTKYANEVVDNMVETGEVKRLWRDFHINLTAARETTESRW